MRKDSVGWCYTLVQLVSWTGICFGQPKPLAETLPANLKVFVGGESPDVKVFNYDTAKNSFAPKTSSTALGSNAIWFEFDKTQKFMISASAAKFDNKDKTGGVFSASLSADGTLKKISSSPAPEAPVSVELSPDGKLVMVAAFNGGSVVTYKFSDDGKLSSKAEQTFKFKGSGPVKERQGSAAAHQVKLDPTGKLLLVPDLGSDKVHSFNLADGKLKANPDITVKAGCGPRHLEYAPEKTNTLIFYLLCELSSDLFVMELTDKQKSTVKVKQTLSVLPKGGEAKKFTAAEILITPDAKFLYTTNRQKEQEKDNIFSVFSRDEGTGNLKAAGTFPTGGKSPRHLSFSPDKAASLVIVSNQDSDLVCVHKRDPTTGALSQVASTSSKAPAIALFQA